MTKHNIFKMGVIVPDQTKLYTELCIRKARTRQVTRGRVLAVLCKALGSVLSTTQRKAENKPRV